MENASPGKDRVPPQAAFPLIESAFERVLSFSPFAFSLPCNNILSMFSGYCVQQRRTSTVVARRHRVHKRTNRRSRVTKFISSRKEINRRRRRAALRVYLFFGEFPSLPKPRSQFLIRKTMRTPRRRSRERKLDDFSNYQSSKRRFANSLSRISRSTASILNNR